MNRRQILKMAILTPSVGLVNKVGAISEQPKWYNADWSTIIVDQDWDAYVESIRGLLEKILGEQVWVIDDTHIHGLARFYCDLFNNHGDLMFVRKREYSESTHKSRINTAQARFDATYIVIKRDAAWYARVSKRLGESKITLG